MATTRDDIREWFDRGVEESAEFMIIACDTFSWDDYPVFCTESDYEEKHARASSNMQTIMEVYDLKKDREQQLRQHRVFNGPKK